MVHGVRRAERRFIVSPAVAVLVLFLQVWVAGCCVEEADKLLSQSLDGGLHGVALRSYQLVHRRIELRQFVRDSGDGDERLFGGRMKKKWGNL